MTTLKLLFFSKIEIVRRQHAVNPHYLVRAIKLPAFLTSTAWSSSISHIHHNRSVAQKAGHLSTGSTIFQSKN